MKCAQETHVLHAAKSNEWSASLREHVAQGEDCAAAMRVAPWMERFANIDVRRHILPDPAVVWLKSQLLRTSTVAQRVAHPMNVAQIVCYMSVAAAWAGLLTWKWGALQEWLSGFTTSKIVVGTGLMSPSAFVLVLVLSSATVMLALHTILADES